MISFYRIKFIFAFRGFFYDCFSSIKKKRFKTTNLFSIQDHQNLSWIFNHFYIIKFSITFYQGLFFSKGNPNFILLRQITRATLGFLSIDPTYNILNPFS